MRKEVKLLRRKALSSLTLSVDQFNRLSDVGRTDSVLMLLDHSFEMLLKASILHRGGRIRDPGERNTIGFDSCVRRALSDGAIKFLSEEQALTLQSINGLRDAAQHHIVDLSEGHLYLHAQAGLTLFRDILTDVFHEELRDLLPSRTLPVSTVAPVDPITLFTEEMEEVRRLLGPRRRRNTEAAARLRPLAILDGTMRGEKLQPGEGELGRLGRRVVAGEAFDDVFPGIAAVDFTTSGSGPTISLRLTKREGIPVRLVPEGTAGAAVVGVRRVNELDFYNLGHRELAQHAGIGANKLTAVVRHLNLEHDPECFKPITIGRTVFKRYSQNAIPRVRAALEDPGIDAIWTNYRTAQRERRLNRSK